MTLSPTAAAALAAATAKRGANKGKLLSSAPASNTLAYAAWQGAMLAINPYKASIAGMMFMTPEQAQVRDEVTRYFDAMKKSERIAFDKDRQGLETMGVW